MRKLILSALAAAGLAFMSLPSAAAVPPKGPVTLTVETQGDAAPAAPVQEARVYCHRNGVFLHWGPCAHDRWRYGYRPYRPYYRPYRPIYRPYYRPYRPVYRYRRW